MYLAKYILIRSKKQNKSRNAQDQSKDTTTQSFYYLYAQLGVLTVQRTHELCGHSFNIYVTGKNGRIPTTSCALKTHESTITSKNSNLDSHTFGFIEWPPLCTLEQGHGDQWFHIWIL